MRLKRSILIARLVLGILAAWLLLPDLAAAWNWCALPAIALHPCACCGCTVTCTWCESELGACEYDVTLAGFSGGCAALNDTFTLPYLPPQQDLDKTTSSSACIVDAAVIEDACHWQFGEILGLNVDLVISEDFLYVYIWDFYGNFHYATWKVAITTPLDCRNVVDLEVPHVCSVVCTTTEAAVVNSVS